MQIFDRWGTLLFESNSINKGWDSKFCEKLCPIGVYTVIIRAKKQNRQYLFYKGSIMIIK